MAELRPIPELPSEPNHLVTCRCERCKWYWIHAVLPITSDELNSLGKRIRCPRCRATGNAIVLSTDGEQARLFNGLVAAGLIPSRSSEHDRVTTRSAEDGNQDSPQVDQRGRAAAD